MGVPELTPEERQHVIKWINWQVEQWRLEVEAKEKPMTNISELEEMSWECFRDIAYYDMWAVRHKERRGFTQAIHVNTQGEAEYLMTSLSLLDSLQKSVLTIKDQEIERLKGAIEAFKKFANHRPGQEVEFFRFLANRDKGLKLKSADDAIWDAVADAAEILEDFPCSSAS